MSSENLSENVSENAKKIVDSFFKEEKQYYREFKGNKDIVKEAQLIINNYIKEREKNEEIRSSSCTLNKNVYKTKLSPNAILNIILLSSIAVLLYFIIKFTL